MNECFNKIKVLIENLEEFELIRNTKSLFLICLQWFCCLLSAIVFFISIQIPSEPLAFVRFIDESSSINITLHVDFITIVINFFKALFAFLALSFATIAFLIYKFRTKRILIHTIERTLSKAIGIN